MRLNLIIGGQVQGVGFRPWLWRMANELGLHGFCRNIASGVEVEIQGDAAAISEFERRLGSEAPPLARIEHLARTGRRDEPVECGFAILASRYGSQSEILISPDIASCDTCLDEIRSPSDRRFGYPFANCTDCGPRFSITKATPYDRVQTTMACFDLCDVCKAEYADPRDRRFHAQPIACPACGPHVWFVNRRDCASAHTDLTARNRTSAIERAAQALLLGAIIAIRGLGGFQLACIAGRREVVAELRQRKRRPHKALALMAPDLARARRLCEIGPEQARLLRGARKPIILCKALPELSARTWLAPDVAELGLMLPYTPLHALLFDALANLGHPDAALVMTSANPAGESICLGNREAIQRLAGLADAWLLHNRDILSRVDDSVVALGPQGAYPVRRSRGYVPEPVRIAPGPCAFGAGASLKATFCLTRGENAFLGQHIGDLDNLPVLDFYASAFGRLADLLNVRPELAACDLHPDFQSTHFAQEYVAENNIPLVPVQHHLAHAVACLADNGCHEPALAICLDGSGLGSDGAIWGGEILFVDQAAGEWERSGGLAEFPLPGGEAAIREPWRIAAGFRDGAGLPLSAREEGMAALIRAGLNCPRSTSAGRLFDAVAAALGLCDAITYEGQAAIRLMQAAAKAIGHVDHQGSLHFTGCQGRLVLNGAELFNACVDRREKGMAVEEIAAIFHHELAHGFADMATQLARERGLHIVALSGGAMQNDILARLIANYLRKAGLEPLFHRRVPPGDGGLSLGQAVWARRMASLGRI